MSNTIAEVLNIDPAAAREVPARISRTVFFETLAKHGISPANDAEALDLLEASGRLEAKRAEFRRAQDPVSKALPLLLGKKQAAAPRESNRPAVSEVTKKTAEFLADPFIYGALLSDLAAG